MKRLAGVAFLALLSVFLALPAIAQNGSTNITIVAAASLGTITPTPAKFYQNTAAPVSFASSTNGFSSNCTATAGSTALPVTYSSTTNALTATLTAAMTATLGNLTIAFVCTPPPLTMLSPVTLPNATVGAAYSANLATLASLSGGVPPYTFSLTSGTLPPGLSLSSSGVVSGTPSGAGSDDFSFTVKDSSGLTLTFRT